MDEPTRVIVSRPSIESNKKHGTVLPVFLVLAPGRRDEGSRVRLDGPCELVYDPENLADGLHAVWIEAAPGVRVECLDPSADDAPRLPLGLAPPAVPGAPARGCSSRRSVTRILVNRHHLRANRAKDAGLPIFSVKQAGKTRYGYRVRVDGPSELVYSPEFPLSCGATVWVEASREISIECSAPPGARAAVTFAPLDDMIVADVGMDLGDDEPGA